MVNRLKHPEIPVPDNMKALSVTERGYFKPWFVKADDFRVVDPKKAALAVTKRACWICGNPFDGTRFALVGSPLSAMFCSFKEPPCHQDCAEYAMQVCPFILYPKSKRRSAGLDDSNKLENVNRNLKVKIAPDNPGEYYLVVVSDFTYDQEKQLMKFGESEVIERQHWIGGKKQDSHPDPIVPFNELPDYIKAQLKKR